MPQMGVYLQFMTGKGTKKWVAASKSEQSAYVLFSRLFFFSCDIDYLDNFVLILIKLISRYILTVVFACLSCSNF